MKQAYLQRQPQLDITSGIEFHLMTIVFAAALAF